MSLRSQGTRRLSTDFTLDEALWIVASFCQLQQISFNQDIFRRQSPERLSSDDLISRASELGLTGQHRRCSASAALAWRLPLIARLGDDADGGVASWVLVLNADESRIAVLKQGATAPEALTITDFESRYLGEVWSFTTTEKVSNDPDSLDFRSARFSLRWFVPELLKHRRIWRDVLIASLVLQLMGLAMPLFTQAIIDKVVVHRTQSTLIALGVGMAAFLVFTSGLTWLRQLFVLQVGQRIDAVLGSQIFQHLFRLPLQYFQNRATGVISARLQGMETVREFIASTAVTLLLDLPFMVIFIAMMFWYSVPLTLLCLGILVLISGLTLLAAPLFQQKLNEQFARGAANQAFLTEYICGMETVKSLQLEAQLGHRYRNLLGEYLRSSMSARQLSNTYGVWASSLEQTMTLGILIFGAWIVMTTTDFTVGMLVAFQMFTARVSQPLMRMVGLWQQWQQTKMAIARLGDVMNAPTEAYSTVPRRFGVQGPGRIELEGLAFRYHESLPYLFENFDLTLAPGQLVVLMGPSGCGKSTLAKLLQGFHVPARGRIRIDGVDHSHLASNELRSLFGVVPQETVLFSGTILENLKFAQPYAAFEQVVAACKAAEIHSVIEALPQGYETVIGERGTGLSGGQRQRLAIARALLKGPKVLLFDESTSGVDLATADQLGRTINALKGRVTILFIAHAIPRSLQADQIVRLGEKLSVVPLEKGEAITP